MGREAMGRHRHQRGTGRVSGRRLHALQNRAHSAIHHFLTVPLLVVCGFVLLAVGLYFLDAALWSANTAPSDNLRWLGQAIGNSNALASLLGTLTTGLITVTSITFSLLLLAVQQGGSSYTNQVFDQFLRRRSNQLYLGYFVGLSIYTMLTMVSANAEHRPVFGTLFGIVLTALGLFLIIVLIYLTIIQSRPQLIVGAIRKSVLRSRQTQLALLRSTRRNASDGFSTVRRVRSRSQGYMTAIGMDRISDAASEVRNSRRRAEAGDADFEIRFCLALGDYVAYADPLAEIRCRGSWLDEGDADRIAADIIEAITLKEQRDLDRDPALGLQQLATIGWTSISTASSNPAPGTLVCDAMRDILARWVEDGPPPEDRSSEVVYSDVLNERAIAVLESLMVVAHESLQHQSLAEILRTFAMLIEDLPPVHADQVEDIVLRSLSTLGEHVLTRSLEDAINALVEALRACGRDATADKLAEAADGLRQSIGMLGSRSTRVPSAGG
ncbi:MAG: DUF2254 family protein [Acetobacteraceae bacterium]|nr:DUF2254 family protein [Acetobacteraceae bacterium]